MDGEEEMYAQTANGHQGMLLTLPNVRKPVKAARLWHVPIYGPPIAVVTWGTDRCAATQTAPTEE